MKWLHLVRNGRDGFAAGLVRRQAERGSEPPTVVLLHEAVCEPLPVPAGVRRLYRRADVEARGVAEAGIETVDEAGIVALLETHDRAAVW